MGPVECARYIDNLSTNMFTVGYYTENWFYSRLYAEFTRTPEHRNAKFIFKRNHVAAASQQKQVLVRLTGILQAFLTYEKRVELLMELMS